MVELVSDIFISYKREDRPVASRLANALRNEGWDVWWDPELRGGEHFDQVIERTLKQAKCVIVLWSEGSLNSQYVRDEATYALEERKLVPIVIEDVQLPFRFRGIHTLRLLNWDGSGSSPDFHKVLEDIEGMIGRADDSSRDRPRRNVRREIGGFRETEHRTAGGRGFKLPLIICVSFRSNAPWFDCTDRNRFFRPSPQQRTDFTHAYS